MKIGASIPICGRDEEWLDQLLPEIERMDVDVAWLLNRCGKEMTDRIRAFPRTVALHSYDGIYHNCLRNYPMEHLVTQGYDWMLQWDADETWEPRAPEKLR